MNALPDEDPMSVSFKCLRLTQPIGDFFVGVISFSVLCKIAHFDVRRVLQEQRDVERYLGIQRPLNETRVIELKEYVHYVDATFPTAIIIAVDADCVSYDDKKSEMTLMNFRSDDGEKKVLFRQIARVLDGQHRIAGLFDYNGSDFDLNVTIFVGIDIAEQAQIFSTVNLEQTKVNKSLAYDLFALAKSRSPQKTCHNVVVALDQDKTSPFYRRIKRLGVGTVGRYGETLTQATFVEALIRFISTDPKGDRDILLRGGKLASPTKSELHRMPFRGLFTANSDIEIAQILWNYFEAVREKWPTAWNTTEQGYILNKTNGFKGLMRILRPMYLYLGKPGDVVSVKDFKRIFSLSKTTDDYFRIDNFPPGSSGESLLAKHLLSEFEFLKQE